MSDNDARKSRTPGTPQHFVDRAGGPTLYEGTRYQTRVALVETLGLLVRRQHSPLVVLSLGCEHRALVPGGQLGYDLAVITPEGHRDLEMKSSPVRDDIVELIARLPAAVGSGSKLQLVHGKGNKWTTALELLIRNAGEAADDAGLRDLVTASGDTARADLLAAVPTLPHSGPKELLASMAAPEFLPPAALTREVDRHALQLAGDRADDLRRRLTELLTDAFAARKTLSVSDVHTDLVDAGLIQPMSLIMPGVDPALIQAIGVLDLCRSPLPEGVLAAALGLPPGGVRDLLGDLIADHVVVDDGRTLWRARGATPIARSIVASAMRDVLAQLVNFPPPTLLERIEQVPNLLALAGACSRDDPSLVARAFRDYEKAAKAMGDLSCVYLLAKTALEAASRVEPLGPERGSHVMWLRAHARICGTSWTLQRVGMENEASAEMDAARRESAVYNDADNLAFVDKCQGRLSRLRAEQHAALGEHHEAAVLYDESRLHLDHARDAFLGLFDDVRFAGKYQDEPGECLALRARTELSQGRLADAELFAAQAHTELDGLGPKCKPRADVCLVDAEIALARARAHMAPENARALLLEQSVKLQEVLDDFRDEADAENQVDVGANEIAARTLQVLGQLAIETGNPEHAAGLLEMAAHHFERVDQRRQAYRCQAQALELQGAVPADLLAVLQAADAEDGALVEAARLHLADPLVLAPSQHWRDLATRGALAAAEREHRWTDRAAV